MPWAWRAARALEDRCAQRGLAADLDEHRLGVARERIDRRREQHRRPDPGGPVAGIELRPVDRAPTHRREQPRSGRLGSDRAERVGQLLAQGIELSAVEGVVHRQHLMPDLALGQPTRRFLHRPRRTRQHDRPRSVHRGETQIVGQEILDLARRQIDGDHPALAGHPLHDASPLDRDPRRVVEGESARHERRRDLAHAVSAHPLGTNAPCVPEPGEGHLDREDHRLGDLGPVHLRAARVRAERVDHRPPGMQTNRRVAFLQRGSELGSALEELESHSGPLGPLAREHEGHPRGAVGRGGRFAGLEAHGELPGQVRRRGPHDREAMEVMGAAHRRGVADVRDGRDLVRFEPPSKRLRAGDQRILSMSGERKEVHLVRRRTRRGVHGELGRLLEHDVRIGAAEAEGADAGETAPARRAATAMASVGITRREPSSDRCGFSCVKWQLGRDRLVLQAQQRLDEPGDAGRGLEVPDVGLHRAEHAGMPAPEPGLPYTSASASTSIGSPSAVPVPWAST